MDDPALTNCCRPKSCRSTPADLCEPKLAKRAIDPLVCLATAMALSASPAQGSIPGDPAATVAVLQQQDERILRIGDRLARGGAAFCQGQTASPGMVVQTLAQYGNQYRPAAAAVLQLTERPTVTAVAAGGAAAAAGVLPGDQLLAADGQRFTAAVAGNGTRGAYAPTAAALQTLDDALSDGMAVLSVLRDGAERTVTLRPPPSCRVRFEVRAGRSQGATADGVTVQVSSGLVVAAQSDGEVAAVLAHELAHNLLRHPQRLRAKEPGLKVRDTELAADRFSVHLLDAAGFAPADAAAFWRRWGRSRDLGLLAGGSHPGWRTRAVAIEAEAAAIAAARGAGRPILPPVGAGF